MNHFKSSSRSVSTALVLFSTLSVAACSSSSDEADDDASSDANVGPARSGDVGGGGPGGGGRGGLGPDQAVSSTCFGAPRPASGVCPAVFLSNELESPMAVSVHDGVAYVATKTGMVAVRSDGGSLSHFGPIEETRDSFVVGDNLVFSASGSGIRSVSLSNVAGEAHVIASNVLPMATSSGAGRFFYSDRPGGTNVGTLYGVDVAHNGAPVPLARDIGGVNSASVADASFVYYFAEPNYDFAEVRRVPVTGGSSKRVAYATGHATTIAMTKDTVFFAGGTMGLQAAPKNEGNGSRPLHVDALRVIADENNVFFVSLDADKILTFFRADSDGSNITPIGQQIPANGYISLALDNDAIYATSSEQGTLVKIPKR